ncbi:MAG: hypothetical protein V4608_02545 [Bacteroidota bacterium]
MQRNESATDLNFNIQYSLRLIEASIDYLVMTDKEENINEYPFATTSLEELVSKPYINCETDKHSCSKEMIKELLKDHERIIIQLQKRTEYCLANCKNAGIINFVSSITEEHHIIAGKFRKFLRANS